MPPAGSSQAATDAEAPAAIRSYGQTVQIPKAAELVSRSLRNQIIRGEIDEGDALPPESVLMQQFGVSRPTLREAVRILESEQLVTVRRGAHGGATVHRPTADLASRYAAFVLQYRGTTLADVYQARVIFEPACVRMVAEHRTEADIARLRATVKTERETLTTVHDLATKAGFHRVLVEISGNQTLILFAELLREILISAAAKEQLILGNQVQAVKHHEEIIDLIERRDGAAAQEMWKAHLELTMKGVLKLLGGGTTVLDLLA
jgi:DNA-binding FadR family transcriptional regulator